ncbi:hypothetical protein LUZ60_005552 [Juncus effusus]|nr:hypothetical protein LUZ60_005552 [Juncus effusus]
MEPDLDDYSGSTCGRSCTCSACLCLDPESESADPRASKQNHAVSTCMVVEGIARVEIENEAAALREALSRHQQSILDLCAELEAERNASASATSEALAMILRLQREKAECQMEARQFRRFAEEKMAHDQQEIATLEELLFKRDQAMQALSCEVQAYKHRLLSYGVLDPIPNASEPNTPCDQLDPPPPTPLAPYNYPPLRCRLTVPSSSDDEPVEPDKYGDTPREHLQKLERRICQLEKMPSNVMEKGVVVGQSSSSPRTLPKHLMRCRFSSSFDSFGSRSGNFLRGEEFPVAVDRPSAFDGDGEASDRIYTIRVCGGEDSYASTPRELGVGPTPRTMKLDGNLGFNGSAGVEQEEIRKLQTRLQALEADRESMRQTLISMGTDKAQMVLLREIAQQFCKDSSTEKKVLKHTPSLPKARTFSLISVIKWITSVVFWRKRSTRIKYPFGLSSSNAGLLLLLEKSPRLRQRRFLTKQRSSY